MKRVVSVLIAFMLFCVSLHADAPVAPTNGLVAFYPFSGSAQDMGPLKNDTTPHGATLDRFLHHAQSIAVTGRSYRLKDHAAAAGKEDKNKKTKSKPNEPSTAEPAS